MVNVNVNQVEVPDCTGSMFMHVQAASVIHCEEICVKGLVLLSLFPTFPYEPHLISLFRSRLCSLLCSICVLTQHLTSLSWDHFSNTFPFFSSLPMFISPTQTSCMRSVCRATLSGCWMCLPAGAWISFGYRHLLSPVKVARRCILGSIWIMIYRNSLSHSCVEWECGNILENNKS